ncbi:DUF4479 domain-containing protein [Halobacillus salinarum]|uniref:DUF4479 domain-containing protein n=1 Tax=Halobacillus salinarum TaxID=2932257 RepID=A0ABY4ENS7_9BACI|nr:DUF4479 family protein [Halobacillus salinarum]UOQ46120.1 DUF4479 domain-containing protein [Halobacillus salinarum]
MDVFYNDKGIGDVLIVPVKEGERLKVSHKKYGDVVRITDKENGSLLGYNIFQVSRYLHLAERGKITLTEDLLEKLKDIFTKNDLDDPLDFDLSPKFVIGFVKEKKPHDNADKLSICQVDVGKETLQIVCGAPNVEQGHYVVVAKVGAVMPSGMKIKDAELRGVPSSGMICSAKELNLPDAPKEKGILVLDDHHSPGETFEF